MDKRKIVTNEIEGDKPYILKEGEEVSVFKYNGHRGKRIIRKCLHCGKIFETLVSKVKSHGEYFCSRDCYFGYKKENSMDDSLRKERDALYQKKTKYGLTEEEYNSLFIKQQNRCAICGSEFNEKHDGCVDHSHVTNKVRGLLCTKCNTLLGMANDDINILKKAIHYLEMV